MEEKGGKRKSSKMEWSLGRGKKRKPGCEGKIITFQNRKTLHMIKVVNYQNLREK